ncbi:MAG: metalloregulator ArsR/SmtB family transcription factor [Candidatus Hadarchaeum sp.]|uniref:ArsR/SmtB family transcription factor n=1 Tax=Candidatus Hadarchaeum sp. TaxID=2883567 RepID=UPI0031749388
MKVRNNTDWVRAIIFKALSDPLRLKILHSLGEGEKCVSELIPILKTVQPLVSRHLRVLRDCGLVSFRKVGNRKPYRITDKRIIDIINMISPDLINNLSKYAEREF